MSGKVVHFEIPFDDGDRARAFYGRTFGWQTVPVPGMGYAMAITGPSDPAEGPSEPKFINGGMFQRNEQFPVKAPNVVIDVPDVDEALRRVEAAGGSTVVGRTPVGDMGFTGYFTDTEGNLLGLWEST
ncbi:VOC family protein [uncultured Nocardioides sp.]|uniref:VOC family protein n=1 Tax=uncultured Nocardioides sp. TaxID=198441 RepID=UPI00260B9846|nr:VOC family protein [uncultured Nocardioides sp.]